MLGGGDVTGTWIGSTVIVFEGPSSVATSRLPDGGRDAGRRR
jgi:hypothetical protein